MKHTLLSRIRPPPIQPSEFAHRRQQLLENLNQNGGSPVVVLQSNSRTFSAPDVPHNFRQCSHFRYLTNCLEPSSCLVISRNRSTLFTHVKSQYEILWEGESTSLGDLKAQAQLDEVLPLTELTSFLASELSPDAVLAADGTRRFAQPDAQKLIETFPGQRVNLFNALDQCRWIKSPAEIDHMRYTAEIASESINATIEQARDISSESVFVGLLEYEVRCRGADSQAYPPVVAAGKRSNTIHYIDSNRPIETGQCVLMDAGADYQGYVSDITRCFPISGHFSAPQKELYEALRHVHEECLKYVNDVRPLKLNELFFHMLEKMCSVLTQIAFFNRPLSDDETLQACEKLCEHHISHYLGMDVHDTQSISRAIEIPPNVVITVEPGIYVQHNNALVRNEFKGVGFRIEDDVLITESGSEILSSKCIRKADDIEALMS